MSGRVESFSEVIVLVYDVILLTTVRLGGVRFPRPVVCDSRLERFLIIVLFSVSR